MHDHSDEPDDDLTPEVLAESTEALQHMVAEACARACAGCGLTLCAHEGVLNVVLGSRHAARCLHCLGFEHREPGRQLCERALQWIRRRECYLHVWRLAGEQEHGVASDRPDCMFVDEAESADSRTLDAASPGDPTGRPQHAADRDYDAGDQGCGDLVLELRNVLRAMSPGHVLRVRATDPAAPIDIPAWCGLTGHTLIRSDPPYYLIKRKEQ